MPQLNLRCTQKWVCISHEKCLSFLSSLINFGMCYKTSVQMHIHAMEEQFCKVMGTCLKNAITEEKKVKSLSILYHNQCNLVYKDLLLKSSAFTKIEMVCAKSSVPILIFMDMCTDTYSFRTVTRYGIVLIQSGTS